MHHHVLVAVSVMLAALLASTLQQTAPVTTEDGAAEPTAPVTLIIDDGAAALVFRPVALPRSLSPEHSTYAQDDIFDWLWSSTAGKIVIVVIVIFAIGGIIALARFSD